MKKKETPEEWSERFIKARKKEKIAMFEEKVEELDTVTDAFLDVADRILEKETGSDRFFFIEERDFTKKIDDFLFDNYEMLLGTEDLDDDSISLRNNENLKLVIAMETNSGSEIPIMMLVLYPYKDDDDDDCIHMSILAFDIPKKYLCSKNSPLHTIKHFVESDTFKDFISSEDVFGLISLNTIVNLMYDITNPSPENKILFRFGLDTIEEVSISKDVVVARNALDAALTLKSIPCDMKDFLDEHFNEAYDVSVTNTTITIDLKNSKENSIYIDITKDPISVKTSLSTKRTNKILNEIYDEISDYRMTNIVLYDYIDKISEIGERRGIIKRDGSSIDINLEKFGDKLFKQIPNKKEKNISNKLIKIMDEYISTHPDSIEFIEQNNNKELDN